MSQPPEQPAPEDRPWQRPGPPGPEPQRPYEAPPPPPYGGTYGGPAQRPYEGGTPPLYEVHGPAMLASRWQRLAGALIDGVIVVAIDLAISLPFLSWHRLTQPANGALVSPDQYKLNVIAMIIGFVYYWLVTYRWRGQTVGKRLVGMRVVRAEDGGPISNGQALVRALVFVVAGSICGCFGVLNVLWILWDRRRQCLHDKAARTVVVKTGPGAPDPYATPTY